MGLKLPLQPRTVPAPGLQVLQHYRPAAIPGLHLRLQSRTASIMVAKKMENDKAWLKVDLMNNIRIRVKISICYNTDAY